MHELATVIQRKISEKGSGNAVNRSLSFVKEGVAEKASTAGSPLRVYRRGCATGPAPKTQSGFTHRGSDKGPSPSLDPVLPSLQPILTSANDWKLTVDLVDRLKEPQEVAVTELRPDITITSQNTKQMAIIELTVPTEDMIEISGEFKRSKYEVLVTEGKKNGWNVTCWAMIPCHFSVRTHEISWITGKERRKKIQKLASTAEDASRSIWKASHFKTWGKCW